MLQVRFLWKQTTRQRFACRKFVKVYKLGLIHKREWGKQDYAGGKVKQQCSHNKGFRQSHRGQRWQFDPLKVSQIEAKQPGLYKPYWPATGYGQGDSLQPLEKLKEKVKGICQLPIFPKQAGWCGCHTTAWTTSNKSAGHLLFLNQVEGLVIFTSPSLTLQELWEPKISHLIYNRAVKVLL